MARAGQEMSVRRTKGKREHQGGVKKGKEEEQGRKEQGEGMISGERRDKARQ